jgi:flavorubredoxin
MPSPDATYEIHEAIADVTPRVRALGALLPLDGRLSWIAAGVTGFAPLHAYLIDTDNGPVLLDTGPPLHEPQILAQLDRHLPADQDVTLVLSRIVEFDSFGNAGTVLERYPVTGVYSQFPVLEWVYYRHGHDRVAREATPTWTPLVGGLELRAAAGDEVVLHAIDAPMRLLATWWFYEPSTRVLFTSDSFGHVHHGSADAAVCVAADEDTTTHEDVREHLLAKFDWVALADLEPIQEQLRTIFDRWSIDAIAPSYGRPIVGADAVRRHYDLMQAVLAELDTERRRQEPR